MFLLCEGIFLVLLFHYLLFLYIAWFSSLQCFSFSLYFCHQQEVRTVMSGYFKSPVIFPLSFLIPSLAFPSTFNAKGKMAWAGYCRFFSGFVCVLSYSVLFISIFFLFLSLTEKLLCHGRGGGRGYVLLISVFFPISLFILFSFYCSQLPFYYEVWTLLLYLFLNDNNVIRVWFSESQLLSFLYWQRRIWFNFCFNTEHEPGGFALLFSAEYCEVTLTFPIYTSTFSHYSLSAVFMLFFRFSLPTLKLLIMEGRGGVF